MNPGKIHPIDNGNRVRLLLVIMVGNVSLWKGDAISICIKSEGHMLLMSIRSFQEPIASLQLIVARALLFYMPQPT